MIESVHFENFKALRDTTLPLGPFTLIVGPNGSGKSTALQALQNMRSPSHEHFTRFVTVGQEESEVAVEVKWATPHSGAITRSRWVRDVNFLPEHRPPGERRFSEPEKAHLSQWLARIQVYSLDANAIAAPVALNPDMVLQPNGSFLAGVLDRLRDHEPERFEAVNEELGRWLPEFDRILFDTPNRGERSIALRTREGQHRIPANDLSQGTLLALAMLTLAYVPTPPPFVGFEEPDRGIHPRLLRDVRDALYRLAYPESFGEKREPVQVVATTHSPYFVDLFRDHPEEIVIAEKIGWEARFVCLTDLPNLDEILKDSHLGDAWYSGILGGVPVEP
ncbi:MAG: AAA family ATPase [Phycisphaerae bacterium]